MAEYANKDVLIETEWLEQHAEDSDIAIVEVDEDFSAYEKGHIQNAIAIN
ncbi:MAG: thiosulfate/3-mercaptopyruvate sulfurtransferase, partial [Actinomycetota bacterium]|nr:thiosulfate/3-mercaptopyruvate sulfurtransferase [Actinomycetota bacterium]